MWKRRRSLRSEHGLKSAEPILLTISKPDVPQVRLPLIAAVVPAVIAASFPHVGHTGVWQIEGIPARISPAICHGAFCLHAYPYVRGCCWRHRLQQPCPHLYDACPTLDPDIPRSGTRYPVSAASEITSVCRSIAALAIICESVGNLAARQCSQSRSCPRMNAYAS